MGLFTEIGNFVNHAADVAGGIFDTVTGQKANRDAAQGQFDAQLDQTIQRRVADGLKAGINPLAAIGASANVSPTIHAGGSNGADPSSFLGLFGSAGKYLKNLLLNKQEDDLAYDSEVKNLDLESRRLENRILRQKLDDTTHNLSQGAGKETSNIQPTRLGDKPIFSIAYDLKDRPRLIVNQDVLEGDSDNAGYSASLLPLIADGRVSKTTGQIESDQARMMLDDMYYNMTGRHIQNLSELYISPTEVALATGNAADQSGFHPIKWLKRKVGK